MKLFHGSNQEVKNPRVDLGRKELDFGSGFYLTNDEKMAKKWACNKTISVLNIYDFDFLNLKVKRLEPNKEWLYYVKANRTDEEEAKPFDDSEFDLIIGPTADDKMFTMFDLFSDGLLQDDVMIKILTAMNLSEQYVLKKQDAIDHCLKFIGSKEIVGFEKDNLLKTIKNERKNMSTKVTEIIRGNGR